jgi:hypothetical protein
MDREQGTEIGGIRAAKALSCGGTAQKSHRKSIALCPKNEATGERTMLTL